MLLLGKEALIPATITTLPCDVARVSRIMFVTTVLSLVTVPACIALLR